MTRKTKLAEKAARIPDIRPSKWEEIVVSYLKEVKPIEGEASRSWRFGMFLKDLFGFEPDFIDSYISGMEKFIKVKQKDRILRGKPDNLFGNIVIEFERNILEERLEAEEQLLRYVAILWTQEALDTRLPYLCIATDGVHFITYSPSIKDSKKQEVMPEEVKLNVLEETDWNELKSEEIIYWLDRYFLRKEILPPTSERIAKDFGIKSYACANTVSSLLALWREIKIQSSFAVIYNSWEKYLSIVYGSSIAGDELFLRHTYLATLAKLMSWIRLRESKNPPDEAQISGMLEGKMFKALGIENFIEEDFFSWLARPGIEKTGINVTRRLFSLLQNYNLSELSEDVLKSLYQELVDPETRHDLGEFYTPDWLAHRIVRKLLEENPAAAMIDPACGSGTFLYLAIREKRERLGNSQKTLFHILDSIYGADIHPLAVIIAKTNYILALGDLLKKRKGSITLRIYLADTLKLPELEKSLGAMIVRDAFIQKLPGYKVELNGSEVHLPQILLKDLAIYDQAIELIKEFARQNAGKPITLELFQNFLKVREFRLVEDNMLVQALFAIAGVLKHFIDENRDTIWAFVLKNIYKPLFFKRKFDFIMGNPPWIAFRYMEPAYQKYLKNQIIKEYGLLKGRGELITHLEVATLFLIRSSDLYLKTGGRIAFVLPRSLFTADQHDGLRQRTFKLSEDSVENLFYQEIWDCEKVKPLFNVPACVLIAKKEETAPFKYPVPGQMLAGNLKRKNSSLDEANDELMVQDVQFSLHTRGKRSFWGTEEATHTKEASFYKKKFSQGATIVPRSFWFVQVNPSPLGINPELPPVETAERAREEAKDAYKGVIFKENIESPFLYVTLLSTDLLPFGHLGYRLVVLPIEPQGDHYRLITAEEANKRGFLYLAKWLEKAEQEWEKRRSSKAERLNILKRLDYQKGLTAQNPQVKYRILYNRTGTYLTAAMVEKEPLNIKINGQKIKAKGFLAVDVAYYLETNDIKEALFLDAILNSPEIDRLIKPMQSRGLWGPRDIAKKIFELPLPKFEPENPIHNRVAEMGKECSEKVSQWVKGGGAGKTRSIGRLRGMVREMLKDELKEIDGLVKDILGLSDGGTYSDEK